MSKSVLIPLVAFCSGLLFGLGLIVSGMINPQKVIGFLDLAGNWDPSLALVMIGALAVTTPAFMFVLRREEPLFESKFFLPGKVDVDGKLLGGAAMFGIGWGLAGFCPGPALTGVATLNPTIVTFVLAMIGGMVLHRLTLEKS